MVIAADAADTADADTADKSNPYMSFFQGDTEMFYFCS
jgi:hypothetical protein